MKPDPKNSPEIATQYALELLNTDTASNKPSQKKKISIIHTIGQTLISHEHLDAATTLIIGIIRQSISIQTGPIVLSMSHALVRKNAFKSIELLLIALLTHPAHIGQKTGRTLFSYQAASEKPISVKTLLSKVESKIRMEEIKFLNSIQSKVTEQFQKIDRMLTQLPNNTPKAIQTAIKLARTAVDIDRPNHYLAIQSAKRIIMRLIELNDKQAIKKIIHALLTHTLTTCTSNILHHMTPVLIKNDQIDIVTEMIAHLTQLSGTIERTTRTIIQKEMKALSNSARSSKKQPVKQRLLDIHSLQKSTKQTRPQPSQLAPKQILNTEQKDQIKEFYYSFLASSTEALYVECPHSEKLGRYAIEITKTHIDYRHLDGSNEKKHIYKFDTQTLKINGNIQDDASVDRFFKMMDQVSRDVKSNKANIFQKKGPREQNK